MNNSVSDHSFYIGSDEEEEEEDDDEGKVFDGNEGEEEGDDNGNDSDSSAENRQHSHNGSYSTSWPQSYRQSIDLYSSVPSPNLSFLGTPMLSRFSSSLLSSSLTRRYAPESSAAVTKPLLPTVADGQPPKQRHSSRTLLPPLPSRTSSIIKDSKTSHVSHELPISHKSSYAQAVLNGMNALCGVAILSTPYAAKEGGWFGILILVAFGVISFYTGMLLRHCMDSELGLETYPDIGQAAFGIAGRIVISIILYAELYACCVEFIILESDNLSSVFPNAHLNFCGFYLNSHHLFALMTTLAVLPTCWLRDLSFISYISVGGVIASILMVLCLFWVGLVDQVSSHSKGTPLSLANLPVAIGVYGFCYGGHAVFPNIYSSMAQPKKFPKVLLTCFLMSTLMYAGVAYMGYTMFGESTLTQFTLNMPQDLVASKIAVWTTMINPFTKYALSMSPVAMSLEDLIPSLHRKSHIYAICIRTALVISTLIVGLAIPFFGLMMSLIGSLISMLLTLILPCLCYLSILRGKVSRIEVAFCVIIIVAGAITSLIGTYSAIFKIVESLSS